MIEAHIVEREAQRSLNCTQPRVEGVLKAEIKNDRLGWKQFTSRLHVYFFSKRCTLYADMYSDRYYVLNLEDLIINITHFWFSCPNTTCHRKSRS